MGSKPDTVTITLQDGSRHEVPKGTTIAELAQRLPHGCRWPVVAATVNNDLKEMTCPVAGDAHVQFVDLGTEDGMRIYRRTGILILVKAAREVLEGCRVRIMHSLSNGLYGEIKWKRPLTEGIIRAIEGRMREIVEADKPITKKSMAVEDAVELFRADGQMDKVRLLRYRNMPTVNIYQCGWLHDYLYGYMAPSTGYLKAFRLRLYMPGFILEFPRRSNPMEVPEYVEQGKLANVYFEAEKWGKVIGVTDVASLNDVTRSGDINELIQVVEALHEKKTAQIADMIAANRERIAVVLIAGPSSSGKTTFAQRLRVQLRVNGLNPVSISLDDYFVDRSATPRDESGECDFESLDAIDLALFNDHLARLIQGEEVEVPIFNFREGRRAPRGRLMRLDHNQMLIIEGIHGLNDRLTPAIPAGRKFKIYASALTHLNIDDHIRIPTTDVRILRRIVRDNLFRGHSASNTIRMWPGVRAGEERNIFPFQETADIAFNSALAYELAVLKPYAEPLLREIGPSEAEYVEAKRLRRFLTYFIPVENAVIPPNSIIREFIGDSCFFHKTIT
ncbi:MAG: nucleoside kinase [Firmicutes bacterium]|jgi:uridine kinase|nr:nucleoside kinase [Bacillota bacterium]